MKIISKDKWNAQEAIIIPDQIVPKETTFRTGNKDKQRNCMEKMCEDHE